MIEKIVGVVWQLTLIWVTVDFDEFIESVKTETGGKGRTQMWEVFLPSLHLIYILILKYNVNNKWLFLWSWKIKLKSLVEFILKINFS